MAKIGRPSKKEQHKDRIYDLYFNQKWSLSQISKELGPAVGTIARWFESWGWKQEDRVSGYNPNLNRSEDEKRIIAAKISETKRRQAEAGTLKGRPKTPTEIRVCVREGCDLTFEAKVNNPKKYCSRSCNLLEKNAAKAVDTQSAYEKTDVPQVTYTACPCGEPIPYKYRYSRKYCSPAHRQEYGKPTATKDPEKWGTYVCQNEKCGKTFEQRKRYGGYHKYCSNACAQRHTKVKKHFLVDDLTVLDSPYESLLWGVCSVYKISLERYDREHGVAWNGEGSWYAPDFKVTRHGRSIAIELKGFEEYDDEVKWAAFREQVMPLVILNRADFMKMMESGEIKGWLLNKLDNA